MGFYQSCLGGELDLIRVRDTPMAKDAPAENQDKVAYSHLKSGAVEFSATAGST